MSSQLTEAEKNVIELLAQAATEFAGLSLESGHPSDHAEFAHHIHILQRQVMARLTRRIHPEIFPRRFITSADSL